MKRATARHHPRTAETATHTVFTIITKVDPDQVEYLTELLDEIANNVEDNLWIPFSGLDMLHFASLVILFHEEHGHQLVFESNIDGSIDAYFDALLEHGLKGIDRIYRCCVGYPPQGVIYREQLLDYLQAHVVQPSAFHIGNTGRSAERIRQEARLREEIETFLDDQLARGELPADPVAIRERIQEFVRADPELAWALDPPPPRQRWEERLGHWGRLVGAGIAGLVFSPVLLIWFTVLRVKEARDPVQETPADDAHVERLEQREDFLLQNHLTAISTVKPGRFRRITLKAVLWVTNLMARAVYTKGSAGGITSIHFLQWALIDGGQRLLFLSNYDGSWGSYLEEFIEKASIGLTSVWSSTVGFPRTWFLMFKGSRDGRRFKEWARTQQTITNVWYSAYPALSIGSIDTNSAIREGLSGPLDERTTRAWLRRL